MATINRSGKVRFGNARLDIWEEGLGAARGQGGGEAAKAWEHQFKKDVFARIVQTLNRLGWKLVIPDEKIKSYGMPFARSFRYCVKGDLKADLRISGRCIELKFFQSVNTPDRSDNEGRYQRELEYHMPYLVRLEMIRTRNTIRRYLCNVFTDYIFDSETHDGRNKKRGITGLTALEYLEACYKSNCHFKGDWADYKNKNSISGLASCFNRNRKSAEGALLEHGQRVFFFDTKGRIKTGIAYYNINNMWWVASGKYAVTNMASFELHVELPENHRVKRNDGKRRKRLEEELSKSIAEHNFERSCTLRDILFPEGRAIYCLYNNEDRRYHRPGLNGYTNDQSKAGRFSFAELEGMQNDTNQIVKFGDEPK